MTSAVPWPQFQELKYFFTKTEPPFDRFSGDVDKFCAVWDTLEHAGCFEVADEALIQLQNRYTKIDSHGTQHVRFPVSISERTQQFPP